MSLALKMNTRGFTLLELVFVVAALTLGAAILLPRGLEARLVQNELAAQESLAMFASSYAAWSRLGSEPAGFQAFSSAPLRVGEETAALRHPLMPHWAFRAGTQERLEHQGYAFTLQDIGGRWVGCRARPTSQGYSGRAHYEIAFEPGAKVELISAL